MRLYNTLTKRVDEFIPWEEKKLKCTPVVQQFIIMLILVI